MDIFDKTAFMLALDDIEGLGRVRIKRIVTAFSTYQQLKQMPFEQALLRLKGIPKANDVLKKLLDEAIFLPLLQKAQAHLEHLKAVQVQVIHDEHEAYPKHIQVMEASHCPNLLYGFGDLALLNQAKVSFFGKPPIAGTFFELAQDLCRFLIAKKVVFVCGIGNGFDTVMHKLASSASHPSIMLANCGLAQVAPSIRPQIMQSVRAGGLLCSSFPFQEMDQEAHEFERTMMQAALCRVSVFVAHKSFQIAELRAMKWAIAQGYAVFTIGGEDVPSEAQPLESEQDFAWVMQAIAQK